MHNALSVTSFRVVQLVYWK